MAECSWSLPCLRNFRSCGSCSQTALTVARSSRAASPLSCRTWRSKSSNAATAPKALSSNRNDGSSSAPSPGSIVAVGSPGTGKIAVAMRSPSSASLPSDSCSESSAIPHEVAGRTLTTESTRRRLGSLERLLEMCFCCSIVAMKLGTPKTPFSCAASCTASCSCRSSPAR